MDRASPDAASSVEFQWMDQSCEIEKRDVMSTTRLEHAFRSSLRSLGTYLVLLRPGFLVYRRTY